MSVLYIALLVCLPVIVIGVIYKMQKKVRSRLWHTDSPQGPQEPQGQRQTPIGQEMQEMMYVIVPFIILKKIFFFSTS